MFKQITSLDDIGLDEETWQKIQGFSLNPIKRNDTIPQSEEEAITRLAGADCCLVSYRAELPKTILAACPDLRFINVCGTNVSGIDLEYCSSHGITVSNLRDYGDEGVVEYIMMKLLELVRGSEKYQWHNLPAELNGKTIGIIGLGVVGSLLAQAALGFKMKVLYNDPKRNDDWEMKGLIFAEKRDLLIRSDIISLHSPKDQKILGPDEFDLLDKKILVNTTLGKPFLEKDFISWISRPGNFAIMDKAISPDFFDAFKSLERVIIADAVSGQTEESIARLSQKTLNNIKVFLAGQTIKLV